jgi:phage baseplate assembly protein W
MDIINPHFDLPFRFVGSTTTNKSAAVVEQNSFADIADCVEAIVRTPLGFRNDAPEFGFPDLEFLEQPIVSEDVVELVQAQEPRARVLITEQTDLIDVLIDRLTVEVS